MDELYQNEDKQHSDTVLLAFILLCAHNDTKPKLWTLP